MRQRLEAQFGAALDWATEPRRRVPVVLAASGVGMLAISAGGNPVPLPVSLAWIVVAAALAVFRFRPTLLASAPGWARPPILTRAAALVVGYIALVQFQLSAVGLLWWVATIVLVVGAARDGQLGAFSPQLLVSGWGRRALTAGGFLVALSLSSRWLGDMYYSGVVGDYYTSGTIYGGTAHDLGRGALPVLGALAMLVIAGWSPGSPLWTRMRAAVLPIAGLLGLVALRAMFADQRHFEEILRSGSAYTLAAGPWVLALAAGVLVAGGLMLRRASASTAQS